MWDNLRKILLFNLPVNFAQGGSICEWLVLMVASLLSAARYAAQQADAHGVLGVCFGCAASVLTVLYVSYSHGIHMTCSLTP